MKCHEEVITRCNDVRLPSQFPFSLSSRQLVSTIKLTIKRTLLWFILPPQALSYYDSLSFSLPLLGIILFSSLHCCGLKVSFELFSPADECIHSIKEHGEQSIVPGQWISRFVIWHHGVLVGSGHEHLILVGDKKMLLNFSLTRFSFVI